VAVDGSDSTYRVFSHAVSLAQDTCLQANYDALIVVTAVNAASQKDVSEAQAIHAALKHKLLEIAQELLRVTAFVVIDRRPSDGRAITEYAHQRAATYILIGSRGKSLASGLFLGSVSQYVSRHAPCPVIIVRETVPPPTWHHQETAGVSPSMALSPLWSSPQQPSQQLETGAVPSTSPPFSTGALQATVPAAVASPLPPFATDASQAGAPRLIRARSLSVPHVDQTAPLLVRSTTAPHYSRAMSNTSITTILSGPKHPIFTVSKVDNHDPVSIRAAIFQLSNKKNPTSEDEATLVKLREVLATVVQPAEPGTACSSA
jgi:nucleotide-binding universal stress UspA family protein